MRTVPGGLSPVTFLVHLQLCFLQLGVSLICDEDEKLEKKKMVLLLLCIRSSAYMAPFKNNHAIGVLIMWSPSATLA